MKPLTNKEQRRLYSIINGSYKKEPKVEELYNLLQRSQANELVVILFNIILRLNEKK